MNRDYLCFLYARACTFRKNRYVLPFMRPILQIQFAQRYPDIALPDHLKYSYFINDIWLINCTDAVFKWMQTNDYHSKGCDCSGCLESDPIFEELIDRVRENASRSPQMAEQQQQPRPKLHLYAEFLYALLHCRDGCWFPRYLSVLQRNFADNYPLERFPEHLDSNRYMGLDRDVIGYEFYERGISRCPCEFCHEMRNCRLRYNAVVSSLCQYDGPAWS